MSVIEILTRVDAICKKYDKYDIDKQKDANIAGDDAFARLYSAIQSDIEAALQVTINFSLSLSLFWVSNSLCLLGVYCYSLCKYELSLNYVAVILFYLQKAETAANEKNRASAVAINAEIRRTKAKLLEEVPKLQRLAVKKVTLPLSFITSVFIFVSFLVIC